ncbi:hypothetical protein HY837_06485 [archaeon]|nr:hypothetical protein [archaeon]
MKTDTPKPFGLPNSKGFYKVNESNELALDTAVKLPKLWSGKLEFLALSGYIEKDYPEDTKEEDFDFCYHIIAGIDPLLHENVQQKFMYDVTTQKEFEKAYDVARQGMFWHHKPKLIVWDGASVQKRIKKRDVEDLIMGSFIHSLAFRAVPLWDKPGVIKAWEECSLTPFEYFQQTVFQFHNKRAKNPVFIYPVTDDEAKRYVLG